MRNAQIAAMLFAAGHGTRMAPLTDTKPKPLIKVGGKTLLDRALELTEGLSPIVVNTHYLADQVHDHLQNRDVLAVFEPVLLETGGGLRNAQAHLGRTVVATLNTDAVWADNNVMHRLLDAWDPEEMDALLALVHPSRAIGHTGQGDFLISGNGRLTRGRGLIYTGAQIVKTDRLGEISDDVFSMNVLWDLLAKQGRLCGLEYENHWCDVGRPESISLAEKMLNV